MNIKNLIRFVTVVFTVCFVYNTSLAQDQRIPIKNINFTKFTVNANENKILIDWTTDNTVPTNYFEIQKSTDGKNFKTIALVLGPDPKQKTGDCYSCFDKFVRKIAKHSYYRLKHIDRNGIEQLSEAKVVTGI